SGFFVDPRSFELTLSQIQLLGDVSAVGRVGFLGVTVSNATLAIDPNVQIVVHMKDPGIDPLSDFDDELVRADAFAAFTPSELYSVSVVDGTQGQDVVLTAQFDVAADIPGADAPFDLGSASLTLTWPKADVPTNFTVTSPNSDNGNILEQFLSFNTHDFI